VSEGGKLRLDDDLVAAGRISNFLLISYSPYHSRFIQNVTLLYGNGQ
jgi:hypothetical protein